MHGGLHMLISHRMALRNSVAAPCLWPPSSVTAALFCVHYVWPYQRPARFRVPRWLQVIRSCHGGPLSHFKDGW